MIIIVQVFGAIYHAFLLGTKLGEELLGHTKCTCFASADTTKQFSKSGGGTLCFQREVYESFNFPISRATFDSVSLFNCSLLFLICQLHIVPYDIFYIN